MFLLFLASVVFAATDSYIAGRIILPEMGLSAPGFKVWFWFWLFGLIAYVIMAAIAEAIKETLR
jgi:phage shock protein PspC (stress-responsive transcriptional regulator)